MVLGVGVTGLILPSGDGGGMVRLQDGDIVQGPRNQNHCRLSLEGLGSRLSDAKCRTIELRSALEINCVEGRGRERGGGGKRS